MIRTQIQFEEWQYERIRHLAHQWRVSLAETVRRLINAGLAGEGESPGPRGAAALLGLAGIGESGLGDLGRHHDEYLAEQEESAGKTRAHR